jgi:hypothetical protein
VVSLGFDADGKRIRKKVSGPARTEVKDKLEGLPGRTAKTIEVNGESVPEAEKLEVFDLATGTERAWSTRTCAGCVPVSGGMLWFGVHTDALSWTADSQHVAFIWGNTVRVLDIRAAGSDILTASKIREHLVSWSTATGQQVAVLNNLDARKLDDCEQILTTNDDGSVLVLTYQRPGATAAIVHDGRSTLQAAAGQARGAVRHARQRPSRSDLLTGAAEVDDAAVPRLDDERALVLTTDFFTSTTRAAGGRSPPPTP